MTDFDEKYIIVLQEYKFGGTVMRTKLSLFEENFILNKKELIYSLKKLKEHYLQSDNEEGFSKNKTEILIALLDGFIELVNNSEMPELEKWWYYEYLLTNKGIKLQMCYCEEIEYDEECYVKSMTIGATYELLNLKAGMLAVNEFALLHNVKPLTVRQWIRRGKLRCVEKTGRDWLISELADPPTRGYSPVTYTWENHIEWDEKFSYLNNYNYVYINQNNENKELFNVFLGAPGRSNQKIMQIEKSEREKLELMLLSNKEVFVEELSEAVQFVPNKESKGVDISTQVKDNAKQKESLYYGPVIVTKGKHKGRVGLYDDDDDNRAIIYFGDIHIAQWYYEIPSKNISNNISTIALTTRMQQIYTELNLDGLHERKRNELLEEYIFCSNILTERYIKSMNTIGGNNKIQVFISHASRDMGIARAIATDLMESGYHIFLDDWSIDVGDRINQKINEALESCNALVMIISEDYLKSVYCDDEWSAFYHKASKKENCLIYPIIIDDSAPPMLISNVKYFRIRDNYEYDDCLEKLLKALKKHYKGE